jgi:hypothetical protein
LAPIFDASFWSEKGVSCSHERNKIGDSVLCFFGLMRLYFCKTVARWAYKNTRTQLHADALPFFGLMRLYFCKTVARWAYKNTRTRCHADALPFSD